MPEEVPLTVPESGAGDESLLISEALRPRKFKRATLDAKLADGLSKRFEEETFAFLERRFEKLAEDFDDISKTNFNPFLLLITAPVYNIFSPFEVAERLQLAKAFHGDDTAFGKMAEDKFLIFWVRHPLRRRSPNRPQLEVSGPRSICKR